MKRPPSVDPNAQTKVGISTQADAGAETASPTQENATAAESTPPLTPPGTSIFGRYEVRHRLGKGGFGEVYLGHDSQLDRPVAIKMIRAESAHLPAAWEKSVREARKLAKLRHPGIVTVYEVGVHEERVFI